MPSTPSAEPPETPGEAPHSAYRTRTLSSFPTSSFCATCQRNQELVLYLLSAYDPTPSADESSLTRYAVHVRSRYPECCATCQTHVDQRLHLQARTLLRRQLAAALARSMRGVRARAPRVRPTLRRKRAVLLWTVKAAVPLVATVALWAAYYALYCGRSRAGLTVAALGTLAARWVNPLWLYVAGTPGARVRGLPAYRRRVALLTVGRLLTSLPSHLPIPALPPPVWLLVALVDLVACCWALSCLSTHTGRRTPAARRSSAAVAPPVAAAVSSAEETAVEDADTVAAFNGLSFGASQTNRDQDDDNATGLSPASRWIRRPRHRMRRRNLHAFGVAESNSGSDAEPSYFLDALSLGTWRPTEPMDVDRPATETETQAETPARPPLVSDSPGPFQRARFAHSSATGLEARMQAFSIDDSQDALPSSLRQHHPVRRNALIWSPVASLLCLSTLLLQPALTWRVLWPLRLVSLGVMLAAPLDAPPERARAFVARVPRVALCLVALGVCWWLVAAPLVFTVVREEHVWWMRWPRARVLLAPRSLWPPAQGLALLVYLDCCADVVALAYSTALALYC